MKKIQVWEDGYACTGNSSPPHLAGIFEAENFESACQQLLEQRRTNPTGWGQASDMHRCENGIHYWWGCQWVATEAAAFNPLID